MASDAASPTDSGIVSAGTLAIQIPKPNGQSTSHTAADISRAAFHSGLTMADVPFLDDSMPAIERQIVELVTAELIWDALGESVKTLPHRTVSSQETDDHVTELVPSSPVTSSFTAVAKVIPPRSLSLDRPSKRAGPFSLPVSSVHIMNRHSTTPASPTSIQPRRLSDAIIGSSSKFEVSHSEPSPSSLTIDGSSKLKKEFSAIRKRRDDEKPSVGTKVAEGHANFVLMYDMLTGLRIAVSRCVAKPHRDLRPSDFRAKHKLTFDIMGNELTPSSKYDFKFKDYAPWVFRYIREHFKIEAADYLVLDTDMFGPLT
jgi:hypothetical protein